MSIMFWVLLGGVIAVSIAFPAVLVLIARQIAKGSGTQQDRDEGTP